MDPQFLSVLTHSSYEIEVFPVYKPESRVYLRGRFIWIHI